jgi:hypothetical protein
MDENAPLDPRLEGLVWEDDGVVSNDQRILDHRPENFTPFLVAAPNPGHVQPHSVVVQVVSEVPSPGHRQPMQHQGKVDQVAQYAQVEGAEERGVSPLDGDVASDGGIPHLTKEGLLERAAEFREVHVGDQIRADEQIQRAFCLSFYKKSNPKQWGGAARKKMKFDRLLHCRCYLAQLKAAWIKAIEPGGWLCLDKSMVTWLGLALMMPGWKVIKRKPHPFGLEFKTV